MSRSGGKCALCGGNKKRSTTTFAVDLKAGIVVVRKVPAFVCGNCGDTWIEDEVMAQLEGIVHDAQQKQPLIEVTEWKHAVA